MKTKIKSLFGVELYEISTNFIYKLREAHPRPDLAFNYLPEFTINTDEGANNRIIQADYFHQFVGLFENQENEKYLYFNLETLDATLNEEIKNVGIEELFKDFDFKKILSNFRPEIEESLSNFALPTCHYLIVEITYDVSYDHEGGYDCDLIIDILGYLNQDMQVIYFDK